MDAKTFVQTLKSLKPSREEMAASKRFSNEYIERVVGNFNTESIAVDYKYKNDPIKELFINYRLSGIELFGFEFCNHDVVDNEFVFTVGSFNSAYTILDVRTGELVEIEYDELVENHSKIKPIGYVAIDSGSFLDAFICAAKLYNVRILHNFTARDKSLNIEYANNCVELAGGEKYKAYWFSMCSAI